MVTKHQAENLLIYANKYFSKLCRHFKSMADSVHSTVTDNILTFSLFLLHNLHFELDRERNTGRQTRGEIQQTAFCKNKGVCLNATSWMFSSVSYIVWFKNNTALLGVMISSRLVKSSLETWVWEYTKLFCRRCTWGNQLFPVRYSDYCNQVSYSHGTLENGFLMFM